MLVRFLEVWGRVNPDLLQRGYNCTPQLRQTFARTIAELQHEGRLVKTGNTFTTTRFSTIYPHIPRLPTRGRWRIWTNAWESDKF
jgi:hypothetical protein